MTLHAYLGPTRTVIDELIRKGAERTPGLIIDCCSSANPHRYARMVGKEALMNLHVVEAESLYRYKPAMERIPLMARELEARTIIITPYHHLFDFGDEEEQEAIIEQSWIRLALLKRTYTIHVGLKDNDRNRALAQRYADTTTHVEEP